MYRKSQRTGLVVVAASVLMVASAAWAGIPHITGPNFILRARTGYISAPDPSQIFMWGYANGDGAMQYPGPTLVVNQGDVVRIVLYNDLDLRTSMVFPGHTVRAVGGLPGLITREAPPGGRVTYIFTADQPGTYHYHSGTNPQLQVEMGLVGALIVRPRDAGGAVLTNQAYADPDTTFDREVLFLETEIDSTIHELVETGRIDEIDNATWYPTYWFLNGRCAPDTMLGNNTPLLPAQPYNCMPMVHPGEKLLMRIVNAGRDFHPFHTHGHNMRLIAQDGRVLGSTPGGPADLSVSDFTHTVPPGGTSDAIFVWTGSGLGWDMYGHQHDRDEEPVGNFPGPEDIDHDGDGEMDVVPLAPGEDPDDHGRPFPVTLPQVDDLAFGLNWSGSPYLGRSESLPPGEGGFNPMSGYFYMWHSHKEKEMVTNDIFPGGMMTMLIVAPFNYPIMDMH